MILSFPLLSHPLAMGLNLLVSTLLIAVIIGAGGLRFWISYTLMLILSGGLLVLFVYVALLASNERFKSRWARIFLLTLSVGLCMALSFKTDPGSALFLEVSFEYLLKRLYGSELYRLTLFIIFYLLVTLLVVVFNTKKNSYPLRRVK
jgi:hypothetical protein